MGDIIVIGERSIVYSRTAIANKCALVRNAIGKIPAEDMFLKIGMQGYKCMYCKWTISFHTCHIDHIHPVSKGGEHYLYNIALTCSTCNLTKGARTLRRFCEKMKFDWHQILQEIADINHQLHDAIFGTSLDDLEDVA